jgi:hypothetical protein
MYQPPQVWFRRVFVWLLPLAKAIHALTRRRPWPLSLRLSNSTGLNASEATRIHGHDGEIISVYCLACIPHAFTGRVHWCISQILLY